MEREPGDRGDYPKDWKPQPVVEEKPKKKVDNDLNKDGAFDAKDKSIAGKILAFSRRRKK